ncbi:neuronal acetylcholine receptor subunit alpha-3-like [Haliotis cracherodii]|uniref:neuronal acetylcholine receptor subunit alpha-3-like n=1 Tax=Haliotis cracherodii TaxID=6455 RepID=UPI0039EAB0C1
MKLPCVLVLLTVCRLATGRIEEMKRLYSDLFGNYSTRYRPVYNQSHHVDVYSSFTLVAITEVDQVRQILHSNVWMNLTWRDEFLTWKPENYNGIKFIHPPPTDIWRPKLIAPVSLEGRDIFKDAVSAITVYSDGTISWFPGTNFLTDCKLDLTLFPFDVQTCEFRFLPVSYDSKEVKMISALQTANTRSFTANGEWILPSSRAYARENRFNDISLSFFNVEIDLERRPTFFVLNVLLPVVALSFLNMFVFALPCDSGEKVSYAITCLLSLTVFMSIVSGLLPKTSDNIPLVTVYMTSLLVISVLSVVATIFIVMRDPTKINKKPQSTLFVIPRFWSMSFRGSKCKVLEETQRETNSGGLANRNHTGEVNESRGGSGGYHITSDSLCMAIFMALWLCVSMGFLINIAR